MAQSNAIYVYYNRFDVSTKAQQDPSSVDTERELMQALFGDLNLSSKLGLTDQSAVNLENLRNYQATIEQRRYNESYRDNEREYTSAQSQLERLMATGMSRSAALQLLNGSGSSGSGSGSGASAMRMASYLPSQTTANNASAFGSIAGGIASLGSFANAVSSCVVNGINASQMLINNQLLQNQLEASNMNMDGLRSSNNFWNAVYSNPDALPQEKDMRSFPKLMEWAHKQTKEVNPLLYEYLNSADFKRNSGNSFFQQYQYSEFDRNTGSRNFRELESDAERVIRMKAVQLDMENLNYDQSFLSYNWNTEQHDDYLNTRQVINDYNLKKWTVDLDLLSYSSTPEMLKLRKDKLKYDANFVATASWFQMKRAQYLKGEYTNDEVFSKVQQTCWILDSLGIDQSWLSDASRLVGAAPVVVERGAGTLEQTGEVLMDVLGVPSAEEVQQNIQEGVTNAANAVHSVTSVAEDPSISTSNYYLGRYLRNREREQSEQSRPLQ